MTAETTLRRRLMIDIFDDKLMTINESVRARDGIVLNNFILWLLRWLLTTLW